MRSHGVWRSLVARFVRDEEAVGSNPATPTRARAAGPYGSAASSYPLGSRVVPGSPVATEGGPAGRPARNGHRRRGRRGGPGSYRARRRSTGGGRPAPSQRCPPPQADRIDHGVDALQRGGQTLLVVDFDAAQLVVLVLSIAGWWSTVPQVARMLCGPLSEEEHARRRTAVVRAARRLAAPGAPAPQDDNRINGS